MIYITSLIFWGFAIVAHLCEKTIPVMNICLDLPASTRYENMKPKMVGVTLGATVHLECNFCNIEDNYEAKNWLYKKRGSYEAMAEINLAMDSNLTGCRVSMSSSHRLDLQIFNWDDSGIYECKHTYLDNALTFTYILDAVFDDNTTMQNNGKNCLWKDNNGPYINLINKNFLESNDEPFLTLRRNNKFTFIMTVSWGDWGPCEYQGNQGIRYKQGLCQVHPIPYENSYQTLADNSDKFDLQDKNVFLCNSLSFNKSFPKLSILLRDISRFEIAEPCHPSTIITNSTQHRIPKQTLFKNKTNKHIGENSHLTLLCPEVVSEATVEWYKDNKLLGSSYRNNMAEFEDEPHITVDSYNALYILHATKNEEAVYACYVDGVVMQMFDVKVVSQSKLLNEGFIRYSIYLGFVLSLTLTCYCAGICVAWHRRSSFADPFYYKVNRRSDKSIHFKDFQEMQSLLP